MRGDWLKVVGLGLAGLVLSAGLGGGAYLLTRDTIGLAVTELEGGPPLAPVLIRLRTVPAAPPPPATTAARRTSTVEASDPTTVGSTEETRTETAAETDDRSGSERGRGRGRSGGDDSDRDD